jgi:cobalt-zinc-cadmium efflux system membrane fusion protein
MTMRTSFFGRAPWRAPRMAVMLVALGSLAVALGCARRETSHGAGDGHGHAKESSDAGRVDTQGQKMCAEHGVPEHECGICKPDNVKRLTPGQGMKVRLASAESAALVGVATATPTVGPIADGIDCYAEINFDQSRLAQVVAPVGGILQGVDVDLGDRVRERQPLARIWSAAIAEAMAKAVLTHQTLERERRLRAERVTAEKDLQEAEAAHRAACQQARTLGFSEADVETMRSSPNDVVYLAVRAPFAGEIVERAAVRGALVEAGKSLFTLVDRSTVWAMLNIPEAALARVRVGQRVELRADSLPGRVFFGKLTWIGAGLDERTRMAQARAEVPNPDGLLRDKMFAQARILTRNGAKALLVPPSALQRVEDKRIAFVRLADDLYEARAVTTGSRHGDQMEVTAGLSESDQVVVAGGFALKSQLLISRLGAGCADD